MKRRKGFNKSSWDLLIIVIVPLIVLSTLEYSSFFLNTVILLEISVTFNNIS